MISSGSCSSRVAVAAVAIADTTLDAFGAVLSGVVGIVAVANVSAVVDSVDVGVCVSAEAVDAGSVPSSPLCPVSVAAMSSDASSDRAKENFPREEFEGIP